MNPISKVTILIKAPNQTIDDQLIDCERHWTVRRLKQHLHKVYPCQPHPDGQKLIYCGQLLTDDLVLSDVLRTYDGLENNTIHLVCSVRYTQMAENVSRLSNPVPSSSRLPEMQQGETPLGTGIRERRPTTSQVPSTLSPDTVPPLPENMSPQNIMRQNLMLQQAYMTYMAQYRRIYSMDNRGYMPENNENPPQQPVSGINPDDIVEHDYGADINEQEAAAEEGQRDDNNRNRDWLEWLYVVSRSLIFVAVLYFYSSPERFIMVVVMALILMNIDVFRWRRGQNQIEAQPGENNVDDTRQEENIDQQHNWIYIVWTFVKTFLLSLVPDNRDI